MAAPVYSDSAAQLQRRKSYFSGPPVIQPEEIEFDLEKDKIGEGCFGTVYRGKCRAFNVAVKVPKKQKLSKRAAEAFKKEVAIMAKVSHPNVCLFMGACLEPGKIRIVTELMKGDLESLLRGPNPYALSQRMKWAKDAAQGMAWLHGNNPPIIHRVILKPEIPSSDLCGVLCIALKISEMDLKVGNMLYDENGRIKVCDFGLSQFSEGDMYDREPKGTPLYMSPEVMRKEEITPKVDVYSFGIILWELLTRKEAFEHHTSYDTFVNCVCNEGERPIIPPDCPESLRRLMVRCWDENPDVRPTFPEIVAELDKIIPELESLESRQHVDALVADPLGRIFWKNAFSEKEAIEWGLFSSKFYQFLGVQLPADPSDRPLPSDASEEDLRHASFKQLNEFAQLGDRCKRMMENELHRRQNPNSGPVSYQNTAYGAYSSIDTGVAMTPQLRQLLCLKAVAANEKTDLVDLDTFGKVLGWFGPLERPHREGGFLDRVVALLREPWFHGNISAKESENILRVQPRGTFLVRFSNSRSNAFCLSKVSAQRIVKHIIIPHEPGQGLRLENQFFPTMSDLVAQQSQKYYLKFPAPGSPFRWLFDDDLAGVGGYNVDNTEEISRNELNVELTAAAGFKIPLKK